MKAGQLSSRNSSAARPVKPAQVPPKENGGLVSVNVRLTGVTPILFNAMDAATLLGLGKFGGVDAKPSRNAEKGTPRDICDAKLHRLPDGRPCVPMRMVYATFINAGQFCRLDGKRQVSTASSTTLPGLLQLVSPQMPIVLPGTDETPKWEVDIQQGKNPNGGEAVCIVRPRFDQWEIACELIVDRSTFSVERTRQLIELAGRRVGFAEFSPRKRGTFGTFAITSWDVAKSVVSFDAPDDEAPPAEGEGEEETE